jgi:hypothetical protein
MTIPEPSLRHLMRMLDDTGLIEHAIGALPRRSHGYCTDDAGRALAVAVRAGDDADAMLLAERCLAFLAHAHEGEGRFHIRMAFDRRWTADPVSDDACGRAIFGIGVAAAAAPWAHVRREARRLFREAAAFRSTYPRAMAPAVIGAAELLRAEPGNTEATSMIDDALDHLPRLSGDERWAWPEERLGYANAVLPEALIAGGDAVDDRAAVDDGLRLLGWLVQAERLGDHFSFTPTGGRGPDDPRPGFDQQPIEAGALADACSRAFDITDRPIWIEPVLLAAGWFQGRNDVGVAMFDPDTGGGFDGLHSDRVNENQGAESTIALITTLQQARRVGAMIARTSQPDAASASRS